MENEIKIGNNINKTIESGSIPEDLKNAIFRYVISLFVPSTAILVIVGAICGFYLNRFTEGQAIEAVSDYRNAAKIVAEQANIVGAARARAEDRQKEIEDLWKTTRDIKNRLDEIVIESENIKNKVQNSAKLFQQDISLNPSSVAQLLKKDDEFVKSVSQNTNEKMQDIDLVVKQISPLVRKMYIDWPANDVPSAAIGGGDPGPETKCPNGYFAYGIKMNVSPPSTRYCIGCAAGLQLICRPLPPKW